MDGGLDGGREVTIEERGEGVAVTSRCETHRSDKELPLLESRALVLALEARSLRSSLVKDVDLESSCEGLNLNRRTIARLVADIEVHLTRHESASTLRRCTVENERRALNVPVNSDRARRATERVATVQTTKRKREPLLHVEVWVCDVDDVNRLAVVVSSVAILTI